MKQRTKAFICVVASIVFFFITVIYFALSSVIVNEIEGLKFARGASIAIMSIGLAFSPLIVYSVYNRKFQLIMTWLIIQGILWQLNVILTVVILLTIVRQTGPSKSSKYNAAVFTVYIILDIIWFLIGYGIWRYWKLLNDIKNFPIYERINLETQGGRTIQPESIDFDSVSLRDFERLAAFGWRRGTH
ncbi:uncharacterized protein LOC123290883 [Chrysoperla carnea]|uniref:uncharacterized protein LOC123290883 n=1 Tax=Chrysoperla carnea TaxID=189513 RepID=UPI001D082FE4|nr:uncharacterized protein LOC123290883 [Chrysoperla carnea]